MAHVDLASATRTGGLAHINTDITGLACAMRSSSFETDILADVGHRREQLTLRRPTTASALRTVPRLRAVLPYSRTIRARHCHAQPEAAVTTTAQALAYSSESSKRSQRARSSR